MEKATFLSTHEVMQLLFGMPKDHKHCRLVIKTNQAESLVLSEALVAAIVRAYVTLKTHPMRLGIEMTSQLVSNSKADFANWQLLETEKPDIDIQREISNYLN